MTDDRLLGFDVREPRANLDGLWDAARCATYLLRPDVTWPLSTDTLVWPSVFDKGQGPGLPDPERQRLHLAGVPVPAYTGPNAGLWEDAPRMLRHLRAYSLAARSAVVIAISWFSRGGFAEAGRFGPYLVPTSPAARQPNWEFLGFDIADGSLLSGLSNCGYLPSEAPLLRAQWGPRLNTNHLFDALADAFAFRDLADARVGSHAPFFVYGLYAIEEIGSTAPEPTAGVDRPQPLV